MAKFEPVDARSGFEIASVGSTPWQMVPVDGSRMLRLVGGQDCTFSVFTIPGQGTTGGVTAEEFNVPEKNNKYVIVRGIKSGKYMVQAVSSSSGAVVAEVMAEAFDVRPIRIAYYFLPGSRRWDTVKLTDMVHKIWFPQANVTVERLGEWGGEGGETVSLPPLLDLDDEKQRIELRRYGNHMRASLLVYFGWTIKTDSSHSVTNGETLGDQTILDSYHRKPSEMTKMAHTIAHELGHFMSGTGHDSKATDLMYTYQEKSAGTDVRSGRVRMVGRGQQ